jgi:tetratricopeptide (TPR) repeat protein
MKTLGGGFPLSVATITLANQLDAISVSYSSETDRQLVSMRLAAREGETIRALEWARSLTEDRTLFSTLHPETRARLLRFHASLLLDSAGDLGLAKSLAEQAHSLSPSPHDTRLQAVFVFRETGPVPALELLQGSGDIDSINLRASILLAAGRLEECTRALEAEAVQTSPNADTHRLSALCLLAKNELDQAELAIQKALELEPTWTGARYAGAVIDYYSAMSPNAALASLSPWPEPVDWRLVKSDQKSVQRLRRAADTFLDLSQRCEENERQRLRTWVLACMANDPEREEETRQYSASSLEVQPTDPYTIAWVISRSINVDLAPSISELNKLMTDRLAEIPHVLALVGCYVTLGRFEEAEGLLESAKGLFDNPDAEVLWTHWRVQLLTASGKPREALTVVEASAGADQLLGAQALALQAIALATGEWDPLLQHLQAAYRETKNPLFLQAACGVKAQLGDWGYVADQAESMILELGTAEAITLAAIGLFNTQQYENCLSILDHNSGQFRDGRLPSILRRMRTLCLQRLGLFPEAVSEAEALAREEPTEENLSTLAHLYFSAGDLKRLAAIGHHFLLLPQLSPLGALSIAQFVQVEDADLARDLWRKAVSQDLPDELVGQAVVLGFRLGLDDELASLHPRFEQLGREGRLGIEAVTIPDFIELIRRQKARAAEIWDMYVHGTIPIHFLVEHLGTSLVDHFIAAPEANEAEPNPLRQPLLYARHGGRPMGHRALAEPENCRLVLDVTAVLLAAHLDLLPAVEARFSTLYIPEQLIPALVLMQEALIPHQPSQLRNLEEIVKLVEKGKLQVTSPPSSGLEHEFASALGQGRALLIEHARSNKGYYLDFLPLKTESDWTLTQEELDRLSPCLVSFRSVLDALRVEGPLSDDEFSAALSRLGPQPEPLLDIGSPRHGSPLYCHANTIEVLADTGLLPLVCECFSVYIEQDEFSRARATLAGQKSLERPAARLGQVTSRLRAGLVEGTYRVIPAPRIIRSVAGGDDTDSPVLGCLRTLLSYELAAGDVIWCDDRYINSYSNRDGAPIVSVIEVLQALSVAGTLSDSVYYQKLRRLRESNARFVPVGKDEILHHLRGAMIREGRLVETRELKGLRRHVAASIVDSNLQRPSVPQGNVNPQGEADFVMSAARAVTDALVELWASPDGDEQSRSACAEWILGNVYLDHLGFSKAASILHDDKAAGYLAGIGLASLVMRGLSLAGRGDKTSDTPRRSYFRWLDARLLAPRLAANPATLPLLCDILKQYLLDAPEQVDSGIPRDAIRLFLQSFVEDLPAVIRDELTRDSDFVEKLGIRFQTIAGVGDLKLRPDDFLRAAKQALGGQVGTAVTIDTGLEVNFKPVEDKAGLDSFLVTNPTTGETLLVKDELLRLLSDSPVERENVLRANRHWFECTQQVLEREVARIASIEDPSERLDAARAWRDASAEAAYSRLSTQLRNDQRFSFDELVPPNPGGLLWQLRLELPMDPSRTFPENLDSASERLIDEVGLAEAINRVSGLPVPLPRSIVASVGDLSPSDRGGLFRQMADAHGTTLSKLQALRLLSTFPDTPGAEDVVQALLKALLAEEGRARFEFFFAVLRWSESRLAYSREILQMPPETRLAVAWTHAHRLCRIFEEAGAPVEWLADLFRQAPRHVPLDILATHGDYWFDISHPRRISRPSFLVPGLSYALMGQVYRETSDDIQTAMRELVMPAVGDTRFPALELLRDPSLGTNGFGSFLGVSRCEDFAFLLHEERERQQLLLSARERAEAALAQLSSGNDWASGWLTLYAVIGDFPIYDTMRQSFQSLVLQTHFSELVAQNPQSGLIALLMACEQAAQRSDAGVLSHLSDELRKTASILPERDTSALYQANRSDAEAGRAPQLWPILLEAAAYLAIGHEQAGKGKASIEFSSVVLGLTDARASVSPDAQWLIQLLCEELPIEDAFELYPLLERLRAM